MRDTINAINKESEDFTKSLADNEDGQIALLDKLSESELLAIDSGESWIDVANRHRDARVRRMGGFRGNAVMIITSRDEWSADVAGTLYVVATPIGNLADLSARAAGARLGGGHLRRGHPAHTAVAGRARAGAAADRPA